MNWKNWYRTQIGRSGTLLIVAIIVIVVLFLIFALAVDASAAIPLPESRVFISILDNIRGIG